MHLITDSILVGNIDDARRPPDAIRALLLVAEEYEISPPADVAYERIPMKEFSEPHPASLSRAVDWIRRHRESRVMVCCRAGMGRSVSVVIAYLCCVEGMPYAAAVALVKARRPGAMPLPRLEESIVEVGRRLAAPHAAEPAHRLATAPETDR